MGSPDQQGYSTLWRLAPPSLPVLPVHAGHAGHAGSATGSPGEGQPVNELNTIDSFGRPLRALRISVTDRCNLRCGYCMPEQEYRWLPRSELLSFEEIGRLVDVFIDLGVQRVRLTGGEPLLRRDLASLVAELSGRSGLKDIALTTNAVRLPGQVEALRAAGLQRVTVSVDSLRPERFFELTRRDELSATLAGIDAAVGGGFRSVKMNTVVMRGRNDDELAALIAFAEERGIEPRFIEYMDVGGATRWSQAEVVPASEILARVTEELGAPEPLEPSEGRGSAPAQRFRLPNGFVFGVIASTTSPFCGACDRARLTADGRFFTCLYAREGMDLRALCRNGATREEIQSALSERWGARRDRGAEERLQLNERGALAGIGELRDDPHLEMHTRGG